MKTKTNKPLFFIATTALFVPFIALMTSWFVVTFMYWTLTYYPINLNDNTVMSGYYSHYQESIKNNDKYKVLLLGLDGIEEDRLDVNNNPDIMHKSLSPYATDYWKSVNRFRIPDHWSSKNVEAAVRGGNINWDTNKYEYNDTSFFTRALQNNPELKMNSTQLRYPKNILAINEDYIEPETLNKMDSLELNWNVNVGVSDSFQISNLFLSLVNAINNNSHLVFGWDVLSDEVAHHGWTISTAKYQYSLWIEDQYVKMMQQLLAMREKAFDEKWMFVLFTDHARDKAFDGQHHQIDSNSLKAWYYTNQEQSEIEKWINKDINSDQRGLVDIGTIITGYLLQNKG